MARKHFTISRGPYYGYLVAVDETGVVLNPARVFTAVRPFMSYLARRYPGAAFTDATQ